MSPAVTTCLQNIHWYFSLCLHLTRWRVVPPWAAEAEPARGYRYPWDGLVLRIPPHSDTHPAFFIAVHPLFIPGTGCLFNAGFHHLKFFFPTRLLSNPSLFRSLPPSQRVEAVWVKIKGEKLRFSSSGFSRLWGSCECVLCVSQIDWWSKCEKCSHCGPPLPRRLGSSVPSNHTHVGILITFSLLKHFFFILYLKKRKKIYLIFCLLKTT